MFRTRCAPFDGLAVAFVLLAAVLLLLLPGLLSETGEILVVTTPRGSTEYDLSVNQTFTVSSRGYTLTVMIENGHASVCDSDCPDGICRTGTVKHSGETILCAPAGVRLTVKGGDADVDFVAG